MNLTPEEHKAIIKQAFKEWLDDKILEFGKWSLKTLGATVLGALLVFLVNHHLIAGGLK